MSFISEAHAQWHSVYGRNAVCPLDCGAGEDWDEGEAEPLRTIICGHCRDLHNSVEEVRACSRS